MKHSKTTTSTYKSLIIMTYYTNNISYLKQLQSKYNFTFKTLTKNGTSGANPEYLIQSLSKQTLINVLNIIYNNNIDTNDYISKTYPITNKSKYKKSNYNYNHKPTNTNIPGLSLCEMFES